MINIEKLEEVCADQKKAFEGKDAGLKRLIDFDQALKSERITVISGIRRSGKSTLLRQFSNSLPDFYYINFDDERLTDFKVADFENLLIVWRKSGKSKNILIDEIQNVEMWEKFIRRMHDEGYKIFVTGSNAKLLSSELATHLTGRYLKIELYPFSFKEFLLFNNIDSSKKDSTTKADIIKKFDEYLIHGGFPEFLKYKESDFLQRTYEDIVYKDIITRFGIKEIKFKEIVKFLFTNFTKEISYNSITKVLNIKSPITVKKMISYLQESYLVFEMFKYDYSLKKQYISDKKIYVIDGGMRNAVSFRTSNDLGRLLENAIFIEFKRKGMDVFYSKGKKECDFVINDKDKVISVFQSCWSLTEDNRKREVDGLLEAMKESGLKSGIIITYSEDGEIIKDDCRINMVSAWKWFLEEIE